MKNKIVAAFLALFAGMFGVHRFYLQRWWQGVMYMALAFITIMITADGEGPAFLIPMVLGLVDALLFFVMPTEDFDEKYNKNRLQQTQRETYYDEAESEADPAALMEKPQRTAKSPQGSKAGKKENKKEDFFKRIGIEQFRSMDFEGAIESFMKALEDNITSPSVHFNLACCYSMIENTDKALQNLEKAIENGFSDISKIQSHQALAYVRKQPEFESFVANGYRIVKQLPQAQPNFLDAQVNAPSSSNDTKDVLDEVLHLGDLREKGLISEEEFVAQKRKLLG
ncbi:NINE protein [Haliscomenobacter sp.]|uniref:TPR end-of-group domain-containing protein n=1 Tax=Haliscomenobacter sp. TaxID=2717303 RepID=UPI00359474BE